MTVSAISKNGMVKVEWTDLGEGYDGDYDPSDPEDEPLLRFDAYIRMTGSEDEDDGLEWSHDNWGMRGDSSFCTQTSANTDEVVLLDLAQHMADELADNLHNGMWKHTASMLSYITPHDLHQLEVE